MLKTDKCESSVVEREKTRQSVELPNLPGKFRLIDLFDVEKLQSIQDAFAEATGVASLITEPDGTPITQPSNFCRLCRDIVRATPKGMAKCHYSDSILGKHKKDGPTIQKCLSGGLWGAGVSITVGGTHVGNWLIGQVRNEMIDEKRMINYAKEIGADVDEFKKALTEVPVMSKKRFEQIAKMLFLFANELSAKAYHNVQQSWFITEQRKAEIALAKAKEELEVRVKERTAELTRSNDEHARFAYVASHDLQEPLRMISCYVRLLDLHYSDKLDDTAKEYIAYAVEGAVRMQALIKGLLDYSRVDNRSAIDETVVCESIFQEVLNNLKLKIEETGARVVSDPLPVILGNKTQILQVFQNLIENALKFAHPDRVPEIRVTAKRDNDQWHFSVSDNGIGIDPQFHDRIFVIFQRLHANRTKYPGTGIGLAIIKRIIERHGGKIWVESVPNQGTTFHFTLPSPECGNADK